MSRGAENDSLNVREWLQMYTDREPPLPVRLLDKPVNRATRRQLKVAAKWLLSIGVTP